MHRQERGKDSRTYAERLPQANIGGLPHCLIGQSPRARHNACIHTPHTRTHTPRACARTHTHTHTAYAMVGILLAFMNAALQDENLSKTTTSLTNLPIFPGWWMWPGMIPILHCPGCLDRRMNTHTHTQGQKRNEGVEE